MVGRTAQGVAGRIARGLAQMQPLFRQGLLGGDTVATPADLCLTATALGSLPSGSALRRSVPGSAMRSSFPAPSAMRRSACDWQRMGCHRALPLQQRRR